MVLLINFLGNTRNQPNFHQGPPVNQNFQGNYQNQGNFQNQGKKETHRRETLFTEREIEEFYLLSYFI
jgi:hypothetical protein